MHYLLFYDFVPDYIERRGQYRTEHLQLAWESHKRGELVLGGTLTPPDSAVLFFNCDSQAIPEQFAATDPYVLNGLVTRWHVRAWTTVVGEGATTPVRP